MELKIQLDNASFSYGKQAIFNALNLSLYKGNVICILGPNGCGKTTLLRCMNGYLKLRQGDVRLNGHSISNLSVADIARKIGFVFQEHSAPFPFSVLEIVRMGRAPHLGLFNIPSQNDTDIAHAALEMVGITHLSDKPYTRISGGERQLVLIARTLAQEPEVILLDEPTSHLDFKNQTLVLQTVKKLAKKGLSAIMTTHLPNHVFLLSGKVILMNHGRFIASGDPMDVITRETLKETYGIDVKIHKISNPENGDVDRFCMPVMQEERGIFNDSI